MQTTLTYTEEQFKQSIIDTFQAQIAKTPNVSPVVLKLDDIKIEAYTTDDPSIPRTIDKLIVYVEF